MNCPDCKRELLQGAAHCICGWASRPAKRDPRLCCWNEYGDLCQHYGCLSPSPMGKVWYCREHYYRLSGWHGMEGKRGNELPEPMDAPLVDELRKQMKPLELRKGNLASYLPKVREPGEEG